MVSASKLRRAQESQKNASVYAAKIRDLISRLAASVRSADHPLFETRTPAKRALVLLCTSDKGLCGGFNNNIIKYLRHWLRENESRHETIDLCFCGQRGYLFFCTKASVKKHYEGSTENPTFIDAAHISEELSALFVSGEYDAVYLAHNIFKSALSQTPTVRKILPIEPRSIIEEKEAIDRDYIFEPTRAELLNTLVPKTLTFTIYYALLENAAGEHGARMTAMDNATSNCEKFIERYTLLRNRARQAAITTELIEIISGAEAL